MNDETKSDRRKVDDDWKARAEAEKEKLRKKMEQGPKGENKRELPPANFMTLVSSFASQAMVALGEVEVEGAKGREVDLDSARFAIDMLGVIKEKTKNNLKVVEEKALEDVLQGLRLRFVRKAQEKGYPADSQAANK